MRIHTCAVKLIKRQTYQTYQLYVRLRLLYKRTYTYMRIYMSHVYAHVKLIKRTYNRRIYMSHVYAHVCICAFGGAHIHTCVYIHASNLSNAHRIGAYTPMRLFITHRGVKLIEVCAYYMRMSHVYAHVIDESCICACNRRVMYMRM